MPGPARPRMGIGRGNPSAVPSPRVPQTMVPPGPATMVPPGPASTLPGCSSQQRSLLLPPGRRGQSWPSRPRPATPSLGAVADGEILGFLFSLLQGGSKIPSSGAGCDPGHKHQRFLSRGLEEKATHEARARGDPESSAQPTPSQGMNFAQWGFVIVSCNPRGTETLPSHRQGLSCVTVFLIPDGLLILQETPMLLESRCRPGHPAGSAQPSRFGAATPARGSGQLR